MDERFATHKRSMTVRSGSSLSSLCIEDHLCFEHVQEIELLKEIRKLECFAQNNNALAIAQYIKDNETIISAEHLSKINEILFLKPHTFVTDFAHNEGLNHLCSLSAIHLDRAEILQHILLIFDTILNETNEDHKIGFHLVLSHTHTIQCITDMFESNDKNVMSNVLKLLTTICVFNEKSFEILINALYSYGDIHDASSIFDEFVRSMFSEHDLQFRGDALKFINAVLNYSPNLKTRVDARRYLTELGFQNIMQELWDIVSKQQQNAQRKSISNISFHSDEAFDDKDEEEVYTKDKMQHFIQSVMDKRDISRKRMLENEYEILDDPLLEDIREQLRVYGEMEEMDHNEMLWNNIDLDDPKELINYLFMKAVHQKQTTEFMNTLIGLCSIPDSKSHLWSSLPKLITYVTGTNTEFEQNTACMVDDDILSTECDSIYNDIDALKRFLDQALDETQAEQHHDIKQHLKELQTENDNLRKEKIELKQKIRKLEIGEKLKREKDKLQEQLFAKYRKSQKRSVHCIVSPTDKIMGNAEQLALPTFDYSDLSIYGTKSFQPYAYKQMMPQMHHDNKTNKKKKKTQKKKKKKRRLPREDLPPKLGPVPIMIGLDANKMSQNILSVNFADDLLGTAPKATSNSTRIKSTVIKSAPVPNGAPSCKASCKPAPIPSKRISAPIPNRAAAPVPIAAPLPFIAAPAPLPAPLPATKAAPAPLPAAAAAAIAAAPPPLMVPATLLPPPSLCAPPLATAPRLMSIVGKKKKANPPEYLPKPRKKMNYFQWQHIKKADKDSVWSEIALRKSNIKLNTKMNDDRKDNLEDTPKIQTLQLNIDALEAKFGKKTKSKSKQGTSGSTETKENTKKRKVKITLLDSKRSYNITLCLSRLKMSHKVLKSAILALSEDELDADQLSKLQKLVPTTEEQELLKNYNADPKQLALAERFVYELKDIHHIAERLELWQFKMHFKDLMREQRQKVIALQSVYNTIKQSESFKMFLQYVLLIGNYMNYENAKKGNVAGFQLKSLLSLESSKSVDKKETLLLFIVKECKIHHPQCLEFVDDFCKDLGEILDCLKSEEDQNKIDIHQLAQKIAEFGKMRTRIKNKIVVLKNDDDTDMFEVVMNEFLDDSNMQYTELVVAHQQIMEDLKRLSLYFGDKKDKNLVFMEILLAFSKTLKSTLEYLDEMEKREKKASQKAKQRISRKKKETKSKPKVRHKKNKESKKESKKEKEKKEHARLLELYQRQREMMNVRSRAVSISISNDESSTTYGGLLEAAPPSLGRTRSSLTMEMLGSITSNEIKKRRENRKLDRKASIDFLDILNPVASPMILKRSPSFIMRVKHEKNKTKKKKKKKKKGVVQHLGNLFNKLSDKRNE